MTKFTKNTELVPIRLRYDDLEKIEEVRRESSAKAGEKLTRTDAVKLLIHWGYQRASKLGIVGGIVETSKIDGRPKDDSGDD